MGRLTGKVALVTGGASGLGKADAELLAKEGAIVIVTDIDEQAGAEVAANIAEQIHAETCFLKHNVASEQDWVAVLEQVNQRFGRLDILVNNAGVVVIAGPEETTLEQFRFVNSVMSEGVFLGCKYAIPLMHKGGGGCIINMSSVASHLGYPVFFAYSAAKGAVRAMTKSIAVHCQMNKYNIRCNSIHAGAIDTPMVEQANTALGIEPNPDDPVGIGEPKDVANLVLFLASDDSRFINGAEILIDNALVIQP